MTDLTSSQKTIVFKGSKGNVISKYKEGELKPKTSEEKIKEDIEIGKKLLRKKLGQKRLDYLLEVSKESLKHHLWNR